MQNPNSDNRTSYEAFLARYSDLSDEKLLEILRNQTDYQKNARNAAMKIAIDRGLIHSEDDLLAKEFQQSNYSGNKVFPNSNNEIQAKRISSSVFRILFIIAVIPFIFTFLKFSEGHLNQAIGAGIIGTFWLSFVFLFKKSGHQIYLYALFVLLLVVASFSMFQIMAQKPVKIADLFILILGTILVAYFLMFANQLSNKH